jgi:hypothetical protein
MRHGIKPLEMNQYKLTQYSNAHDTTNEAALGRRVGSPPLNIKRAQGHYNVLGVMRTGVIAFSLNVRAPKPLVFKAFITRSAF